MRTFFSALLLLVAGGVQAQTTQPWQPDADGDGLINIEDMVQFLTVFNTQWGPDLTVACDYQGTDLETLFADLMNGDAQLDSLYFAYSIYDSAQVYVPECPEPVTVYNLVERSGMITSFEHMTFPDGRIAVSSGEEVDGHYVFFDWRYTTPALRCIPSNLETPPLWRSRPLSSTDCGTTPTTTSACRCPRNGPSTGWAFTFRRTKARLTNTGIFNLCPIGQRPQRTAQKTEA